MEYTVAVLSAPTSQTLLRRADGGCAFDVILKIVPKDAASNICAIISIFKSVSLRQH